MSSLFDAVVDEDTLALARGGDRVGLERLYRAFERAVFTLARRMTHCPDAAADVMQNTFLRAFRSIHQYRGEAPFGHWLRSICATEALMHLRAGRRFLELFEPAEIPDEKEPAVEDICQFDLEKALSLLPPLPRSVLWLYHVEGYNHAEIAALCGKTVSFSKSQLSRAHGRLRQLLADDAQGAPAAAPLRPPLRSLL
ncbi:RNA polymerase sigma factor [Sinimarinibacterium flocculans]|uniref:RNA polymerase sigma-70 factor (ECF subfamily) n=1 Tax=Sinimarinibacterium flocculans TaxID=985250 RepID=A0A318E806_9GAMM|nr:sigma-70 family RNA polymerase sigma factor [Sinimarinibacterium flocculans]PXV67151.1 RNA polymerase sigma-70 factor (ECF subfamily) [Sinimarinibacterium flocculans]